MGSRQINIAPDRPLEIDDFTAIHGIGTGIENRLVGAGITTYDQLAQLSADKIAVILGNVVGLPPAGLTRRIGLGKRGS